jgi:protein phosphatase
MMQPAFVRAAMRTDPGLVRDHNEDFVTRREPLDAADEERNGWLYIVADGVGGADAGEVASQYASERTIYHYLAGSNQPQWGQRLLDAMQAANTDLRQLAAERNDNRRMATTMVTAAIYQDRLYLCNVGDSRGYLWRDATLQQLTKDQSLVARLVEEGAITAEEAASHPHKNVILYSIGSEKRPPIDLFEHELQAKDKIILCSDGLTRHVEDGEIGPIIERNDLDTAADVLVRLARERGGEDNISVAIIEYGVQAEPGTVIEATRREAAPYSVAQAPVAQAPVARPARQAATVATERRPNLLPFTLFLAFVMVVLIYLIWFGLQRLFTV